ncbi:MAG: hypothetical protein FWD31_07365 [Planctomycetaceae bacterium]|nr:hypothetical protein [Planctomycetaceae bacterium]
MPHLDAISFFIVALPICAAAFVGLWNCSFAKRLRFADGLRFVAVWMLFTVVVLVMNQIGRETLDPGRWPREYLFHGVPDARVIGAESVADAAKNLLLGWALFPMRVIPQAQFYLPAMAVGLVATLFAMIFTEICGRLVAGKHWKIRWTFCSVGAFWCLFFTTYATVGLVRQIGWIVF